jgi:hypothetical protein
MTGFAMLKKTILQWMAKQWNRDDEIALKMNNDY